MTETPIKIPKWQNLTSILKRNVHLPDPIDDQNWYELQNKNKQE